MELFVGFLLGIFGGVIANYFSPSFANVVSRALGYIAHCVNPERFDLKGAWQQEFEEPDPNTPSMRRKEAERIELIHLGSSVKGAGETKLDKRLFTYDLCVSNSMVFGSYKKNGQQGNLTGQGMIQLIVSADRTEMTGQATWYDRDTNKIESSAVVWRRL